MATLFGARQPDVKGIERMAREAATLVDKREVEYFSLEARSILNRCSSPRMPFAWTINPYRGCEFGCRYCYARYTHEYMVEKISRDVRITTIYEGTSEIMEMTISRDRWQSHLKTRGQHYHEQARGLEGLHGRHGEVGADVAAFALHALAEAMEKARVARLTRHQHILLRLGELIAYAECAGSLARRAARMAEGRLNEKANQRFDASALAALSRIFAREAALKVGEEGVRLLRGADGVSDAEMAALETSLGLSAIHRAQAGLISDMDYVADVLYNRAAKKHAGIAA